MSAALREKELQSTDVDVEEATMGRAVHRVDVKSDDVAGVFLASIANHAEADALLEEMSPIERKKLIRKVDMIVMPLLWFALMMGSVDKVALGTAAVLGLRTDNHLVGQDYSWCSAMIFFGAITAIFPSLYIMQKTPANYYLSFNVMMWGIITMCMAACNSYRSLLAVRYLLGLFESVIFAAFGLIISMWWTRAEQPYRTAFIFSTFSSVTNGVLSTACVRYSGHFAKWRLLFLMIGAITFAWSMLMWAFLPANPTSARWLSLRQRVIATRRMQANHTGIENKTFKIYQVLEALRDPKTWFYFLINICLNVPNGGTATFNSIIIATLGFNLTQTTLLGIPTGVISWSASIFFNWVAVKIRHRTGAAVMSAILPLIGTILLYKLPRTNFGGSLVALYLVNMFWAPYVLIMGSSYANTGGYTKKITVFAISYIGYCVGNIVGPQTFRAKQAPKYVGGVVAMLVCYCAAILLIIGYGFYIKYLNRRKERELAEYMAANPNEDKLLAEWQDETDLENPRFVYQI